MVRAGPRHAPRNSPVEKIAEEYGLRSPDAKRALDFVQGFPGMEQQIWDILAVAASQGMASYYVSRLYDVFAEFGLANIEPEMRLQSPEVRVFFEYLSAELYIQPQHTTDM
jgi:hypothetical protein